jgi:enoyl-CoA hydratase
MISAIVSEESEELRVDLADGLAVLTIDRPQARNAIGFGTMDDLEAALDRLAKEPVGALVIRGAGDAAFVSGGDLKELSRIRDEAGAIAMATRMRRLLDRMASFPAPVIAAVNGHALGGGAEVAVAADVRVAAADVRIGFTQVRLGIMPAWGGAERLAELVGRSRALLLVGTGRVLDAADAERIGLVDVVAPRETFEQTWRTLAADFAALPEGAGRAIKDVIAAVKPNDHPMLETAAVRRFAGLWVGEDHWRAADALAARRSRA